ncbi:MAG: hypothetical protein HPY84_07005 [Syntrophobacteraceae bacterium]|nr:hypothetical protein [Syntrophobacteraceae bacterium]
MNRQRFGVMTIALGVVLLLASNVQATPQQGSGDLPPPGTILVTPEGAIPPSHGHSPPPRTPSSPPKVRTPHHPPSGTGHPSSPPPPTKRPDRFKIESQLQQAHKSRVSKINARYYGQIGSLESRISDLRYHQTHDRPGNYDLYERQIRQLENQIQRLGEERQQRIQDSRDLMKRQLHQLWNSP